MRFEFITANRILFGNGTLKEIEQIAPTMGKKVLVVTGRTPERADPLLALLKSGGVAASVFSVAKEPTIDVARDGANLAKRDGCDFVIAFGGGSALDSGKAIAALATNHGDPLDYLEVIGKGQPLLNDPLPVIAIPTTSGTGSEVTKNAVLASEEHRVKVSLRHPKMLPSLALVDPELTYSVPASVTAYTGMDALTQVLEPYVSHLANPMTDALALEGLRRAARSIRRVYENGDDVDAREDMALTSLMGGLALANAKLGAVHGFAGPLGGMYPGAPHGAICAALLPHVMAVNVDVMRQRDADNPALARYDDLGEILAGKAGAMNAVTWAVETAAMLEIQPLSAYGVRFDEVDIIIGKAFNSSSMKGNPIKLTSAEMRIILERAM